KTGYGSCCLAARVLGLNGSGGLAEPIEVCGVKVRARGTLKAPPGNERIRRVAAPSLPDLDPDAESTESIWRRLRRPSPRLRRVAGKGALLTAALGVVASLSTLFSGPSYDLSYLFRPQVTPEQVIIVEMDEPSMKKLKQDDESIWDRRLHAQVLAQLHADQAKAVCFDVLFQFKTQPGADGGLCESLKRNGPAILSAAVLKTRNGHQILAPHTSIRDCAKWGLAEEGNDSHPTRWPAGPLQGYPTTGQLLTEIAVGRRLEIPRGAWLNYYGPPGTIARRSFASVVSNEIPAGTFSNKFVFVGANREIPDMINMPDKYPSPYSKWGHRSISGVELNATSFLNLLRGEWLYRLSLGWELLLVVITGLVLGYLLVFFQPGVAVLIGLVAAAGISLACVTQVWVTGIWFPWLVISAIQVPTATLWAVTARTRLTRLQADKIREFIQGQRTTSVSPHFAPGGTQKVRDLGPDEDGHPTPVIPDHVMIRCVGKGAYGRVWLASDVLGSYHAVKVIHRDRFPDAAPFDREFKGLQKYTPISRSHPGLVQILHVGIDEASGFFFYIMEAADDERQGLVIEPASYVPRTLSNDVSHRGAIPLDETVELGVQIAEALAFLHRQRLVHRDLKPANIIFVNGRPKIADIGLVANIGEASQGGGTPGYIPQEGPGLPPADIFSLGRLLYVALSGRPVKEFPSLPETVARSAPADQLRRFENVLLRACETIDTDRYQTAEELLAALNECQPTNSGHGTDKTPTTIDAAGSAATSPLIRGLPISDESKTRAGNDP
ncbi:MAG TPA: hypothetical protein DCE44_15245, partial [Verrucomicrobiales bacterium]|nr:hypothetical protein [Verrucomicrobiales bacterium]